MLQAKLTMRVSNAAYQQIRTATTNAREKRRQDILTDEKSHADTEKKARRTASESH